MKIAERFLQKQCTVRAAFADADAFFLEWLWSSRSLSPWFCAFLLKLLLFVGFVQPLITNSFEYSNTPYLKMADFCALKAKFMFISLKICLINQDPPYISAPEMAWNMQMSTNDNSIHAQRLASLATNSHSFTLRFPYFLETLCPYFEKYRRTTMLPADFRTNSVKYGQLGRSVMLISSTHFRAGHEMRLLTCEI